MKATISKTFGSYTYSEVFEFDVSIPAEKELAEKMIDHLARYDEVEMQEDIEVEE